MVSEFNIYQAEIFHYSNIQRAFFISSTINLSSRKRQGRISMLLKGIAGNNRLLRWNEVALVRCSFWWNVGSQLKIRACEQNIPIPTSSNSSFSILHSFQSVACRLEWFPLRFFYSGYLQLSISGFNFLSNSNSLLRKCPGRASGLLAGIPVNNLLPRRNVFVTVDGRCASHQREWIRNDSKSHRRAIEVTSWFSEHL